MSDHIPLRQALVNLSSCGTLLTGRETELGAWPVAGRRVIERPVSGDAESLKKRLKVLEDLAENAGVPARLIVPPTAGMLCETLLPGMLAALYEGDESLLDTAAQGALPLIDLRGTLNCEDYFRTDHHWNLSGAYKAYAAYCAAAGLEPSPLSEFSRSEFSPFCGTTLSRSGLPRWFSDTLLCAQPQGNGLSLLFPEEGKERWSSLIFPEKASGWDGYAVYLNGNHGLTVIENKNARTSRSLLVFRDSFASILLPLLAENYARITAVDLRYLEGKLSEAFLSQPDEILFVYSLDSLTNDSALLRKSEK